MEPKYIATYHFCDSKAVVHVVAPPVMTEGEKQQRLREFYLAAWAAWNSLPVEERLKLNLGVDLTKILQRRLQKLIDKVEQESQGDQPPSAYYCGEGKQALKLLDSTDSDKKSWDSLSPSLEK